MGTRERRERERKMRKNQILGAARELLADNGIAGTSMNQIAERAELSVGTVYIYFKNKEDLYASLQEEGLDLLYDSITKAVEKGGTPLDKLRQIARAYLKFSEKELGRHAIVFWSSLHGLLQSRKLESTILKRYTFLSRRLVPFIPRTALAASLR